jgi:hypothetical protein
MRYVWHPAAIGHATAGTPLIRPCRVRESTDLGEPGADDVDGSEPRDLDRGIRTRREWLVVGHGSAPSSRHRPRGDALLIGASLNPLNGWRRPLVASTAARATSAYML